MNQGSISDAQFRVKKLMKKKWRERNIKKISERKEIFQRKWTYFFFLGKSRSLYADLQRIAKMLVCEVNKSVFIYLLFIGFSFFLSRFGLQKNLYYKNQNIFAFKSLKWNNYLKSKMLVDIENDRNRLF